MTSTLVVFHYGPPGQTDIRIHETNGEFAYIPGVYFSHTVTLFSRDLRVHLRVHDWSHLAHSAQAHLDVLRQIAQSVRVLFRTPHKDAEKTK